jgi:hypothetical protein
LSLSDLGKDIRYLLDVIRSAEIRVASAVAVVETQ